MTGARGFAVKFYDILTEESSDIITWTKSGQAFQVVDYARFSEEILLKVRTVVVLITLLLYCTLVRVSFPFWVRFFLFSSL